MRMPAPPWTLDWSDAIVEASFWAWATRRRYRVRLDPANDLWSIIETDEPIR